MAREDKPTDETLIETDIDEGTLTFLDGTMFSVAPGDIVTICTWLPMNAIQIAHVDPNSAYPYELTNSSDGVAVRARRLI